ncbi:aminoacyltransferase [Chloroflexia bacterium SDU3-3]|nr:aminoacyltransferase [Chloroflexia bacterium SDU3-3]
MANTRELIDLGDLDAASPLGRRWEELVQRAPASGVMQSLHWAAWKRAQGFATLHLGLMDGQDLAGGAIFYTAQGQRMGLMVAPEGPVLPWDDHAAARQGLGLLLAEARGRAAQLGALALRVEPRLPGPRPPVLREFRRAPLDLLPCETLYLDLAQGEQAVLAQMRPKGRYNIRLAARHGVAVRESRSAEDLPAFYDALSDAATRDDFFIEPYHFFADLCAALMPAGHARLLLAEHGGDLLGAMLLITYGQRATYLYGGVTNAKRQMMGGYALQWAAIQSALASGCATYDFYGYEPFGTSDHLYAGFSRFKRQFGGTPVRFIGAHDYAFLDRIADTVVRIASEGRAASALARSGGDPA